MTYLEIRFRLGSQTGESRWRCRRCHWTMGYVNGHRKILFFWSL